MTDHLLEDARVNSQLEQQQHDDYQAQHEDQNLPMEMDHQQEEHERQEDNVSVLSADNYDDMFFE